MQDRILEGGGMDDEFQIMPFSIDDFDEMIGVWVLASLSYKPLGRDTRDSIGAQMKEDPGMFLCARVEGKMIGVVIGSSDGRKGYINRLAVIPDHRGKGIAKALITAIEDHLNSQGLRIITVLIEDASPESMDLFRSSGYFLHEDIRYLSKRESGDV